MPTRRSFLSLLSAAVASACLPWRAKAKAALPKPALPPIGSDSLGALHRGYPVRLSVDGGTDGTCHSAASWTYTVHDADTGDVIAERLTFSGMRDLGKRIPAMRGIVTEKMELWWCDEQCAYATCD